MYADDPHIDTRPEEDALIKLYAGPDLMRMKQADLEALRRFLNEDAGRPGVVTTLQIWARKMRRKLSK